MYEEEFDLTKKSDYEALAERKLEQIRNGNASYQQMREYRDFLEHGTQAFPESSKLWRLLGTDYSVMSPQKNDAARAAFENALKLKPKSGKTLTEYARFLTKTGQYDEAIHHIINLIDIETPKVGKPYFKRDFINLARNLSLLGHTLEKKGELALARACFGRAYQLDPDGRDKLKRLIAIEAKTPGIQYDEERDWRALLMFITVEDPETAAPDPASTSKLEPGEP